jgi:hypothetical protein
MKQAKTGWHGHARRHILRARRDLWQVESDGDRRLAHFYLAAASQAAGDLEAAIDGYRAALEPRAAHQDLLTRVPLAFCLDGAAVAGRPWPFWRMSASESESRDQSWA